MRRILIATVAAAGVGLFGSPLAYALPASPVGSLQAIRELDQVSKVAICFYISGWNGPGLYDCGFRWRRGKGWHGKRKSQDDEDDDDDDNDNDNDIGGGGKGKHKHKQEHDHKGKDQHNGPPRNRNRH